MAQFITIVESPNPLPKEAVVRLAELLGSDAYTIQMLLKRPRPLILGNPVADEAAGEGLHLLQEYQYEAYAFDMDEVRGLPDPRRVRTLKFFQDHLRFVINDNEVRLSQWSDVFLLVAGHCRQRVDERSSRLPLPTQYGSPTASHETQSTRENTSEKLDFYFFDGSEPMRMDSDRFSFLFLGSRLGLTDAKNMALTIQMVRKLAPHAILDEAFEQFRRGAGGMGRSHQSGSASLVGETSTSDKRVDDDGPRFDFYSRLAFFIHLRRAERGG